MPGSDSSVRAAQALLRFVGQEVNIFGSRSCDEHENCLGGGFLMGLEGDYLLLSERPNETADLAIAIAEVAVVAVVKDRPELTAMEGGKLYRLRKPTMPSSDDRL